MPPQTSITSNGQVETITPTPSELKAEVAGETALKKVEFLSTQADEKVKQFLVNMDQTFGETKAVVPPAPYPGLNPFENEVRNLILAFRRYRASGSWKTLLCIPIGVVLVLDKYVVARKEWPVIAATLSEGSEQQAKA